MAVTPLPERKAWQKLKRHHAEIAGQHLRELFAADPARVTKDHAVKFLALVDALLFAISAQRDRSLGTQSQMR